jgi:hypothetical protein
MGARDRVEWKTLLEEPKTVLEELSGWRCWNLWNKGLVDGGRRL